MISKQGSVDIKICGLSTAQTVLAAAEAGAAFLGFVFHPGSPRAVTPEQGRLLSDLAPGCQSVALLVDPDDRVLDTVAGIMAPDWVQLHGAETPDRVAAVRDRLSRPVIKAVGIGSEADVARAHDYDGVADRLLFDARPAQNANGLPGGQGIAFNWGLVAGQAWSTPWFVAGGLDPDTVCQALDVTAAPGVDVSSGVERTRGEKSTERIKAFIEAVRRHEAEAAAA